jgi:HK97 family phage major capsid protein
VAREVIQSLPEASAALNLFRRIPMSDRQTRLPVLSALPVAYFVDGDTGLKQTTEMAWDKKNLIVEEIAAIVPIPEAVLDDSNFDVWGEVRPRLVEAIGRTLDAAIIFGTNKPASWPAAIVPGAVAASNVYARAATAAQGGIAEDVNQTMALVEADGFDVNGFVTSRSYRARFRGARGTDGQALLDVAENTLYGEPVRYALRGMWPSGLSAAELIAGDWTQGILGVRQDITWKLATEGVIQDAEGAIILNLFQQDSVALRVTFRCAWQVANPITVEKPTLADATRYPFAVLRSPAA